MNKKSGLNFVSLDGMQLGEEGAHQIAAMLYSFQTPGSNTPQSNFNDVRRKITYSEFVDE